jgi:membrane protein implicated in regulation of membrane protease activity
MEPIYTAYNTPGNVNIQIDDEAKAQLKTIATWAQILAIIELASAGLSLVVSVYSALRYSSVMGLMGWTMVGSLFGVAIQVILASMLLRFSTRTSRALLTEDQEELT